MKEDGLEERIDRSIMVPRWLPPETIRDSGISVTVGGVWRHGNDTIADDSCARTEKGGTDKSRQFRYENDQYYQAIKRKR